jgi:4-hydroxybenzoate polyprenyltransferase
MLRPPNVFTAVADSAAALAIARGGTPPSVDPGLWTLPASAALYLGGIAFNDYFDRSKDARERPQRPIPSGRVRPSVAVALGGALLAAGVGFAGLAGSRPLGVAVLLALAILAYDGGLKASPAGYVTLGACRGLNFLMPLTLSEAELPALARIAPILLAGYATALTFLSRDEVTGNPRGRARRGVAGMAGVFASIAAAFAAFRAGPAGWAILALAAGRAGTLFLPLWRNASGPATGRAIAGGIVLIPVLDSAFVAAAGHLEAALVVAGLAAPAALLRRFYSPT